MKIKDLITTSSKWEDSDPTVRLDAITSAPPDDEILLRLIDEDPDSAVRAAAVAQLRSVAGVQRLLGEGEAALAATARQRFVELLATTTGHADASAAIAGVSDPSLLCDVVLSGADADLRGAALGRIDDQESLARIALEANLAHLRQQAASRVEERALLERLLRETQHRDKSVYKVARDKLTSLHAEEVSRQENLDQCRQITEALEQHAASVFSTSFERKWKALNTSWHELELALASSADAELGQYLSQARVRVDAANAQCEEKILEARPAPAEEPHSGEDHAGIALGLCDSAEQLFDTLRNAQRSLAELKAELASLEETWRDLPKDHLPDNLTARYIKGVEQIDRAIAADSRLETHRNQLNALLTDAGKQQQEVRNSTRRDLQRLLGRINWPDDLALPDELKAAQAELERLDRLRDDLTEREQRRKEELLEKLDLLDAAIASGELKRSEKLFKEAQQARSQITSKSFQHDRINQISVQIRELRDWQGYATNPKREELCERMEALIDEELHPRDRAERIKALQQEWKGLGPSHSYKSQKLWYRFKDAGDTAYAPCLEYFREQEAIRAANLRERETICTHLETFLEQNDWEHVDWKAVAEIVNTARREWRRFDNVSRAKRKPIQTRFYRVIDQLQAKLRVEQDRNRDLKKGLIERVSELVDESVELATAINKTKAIQQEWKSVGVTERKTDQALWAEFRRYCDAVFERRSKQIEDSHQQEGDLLRDGEAICGELEAALAEPGDRVAESLDPGRLQQARRRFAGLRLPPRGRKALQTRFENACRAYEQELKRLDERMRQLTVSELKRRAELCRVLENECTSDVAGSCRERWDSEALHTLPQALARQIESRWQFAQKIAEDEATDLEGIVAAKLKEAELICVRAELLAGIESPPEAQALLMEYQVSRLNKELSRGEKETRPVEEQMRSLQFEWYCLGPLPEAHRVTLEQRFDAASEAMGPSV